MAPGDNLLSCVCVREGEREGGREMAIITRFRSMYIQSVRTNKHIDEIALYSQYASKHNERAFQCIAPQVCVGETQCHMLQQPNIDSSKGHPVTLNRL